MSDEPVKLFKTQKAFDAWLSKNYASNDGIWLRIAKKKSAMKSVTYQEALDVALCHGWIDGLRKAYDEDTFIQRFTPRRARSIWSKINRAKALELIEQNRMQAGGHAAIENAKGDGRWDAAYDSYRTITVPDDLAAELAKKPKAKKFFETLDSQNRYAVLFRIQTAPNEAIRKKRIDQFVAMLARGEKLH